ncbi:MAG: DUF1003 domain-containing protein [Propionibacterium sp.]|nr:DUF1003 domain-containing protein [Propionibacterium sp.]
MALGTHRTGSVQLRVADKITAFAGSMPFVYTHALVFIVWMLAVEKSPWPTLTLVVSLEAIFLSTFVMIGQNRQSAFQQAKADHDFVEQEMELKTNTEITREIHTLTTELHRRLPADQSKYPTRTPTSRSTCRPRRGWRVRRICATSTLTAVRGLRGACVPAKVTRTQMTRQTPALTRGVRARCPCVASRSWS